jgi:hypothetical protein
MPATADTAPPPTPVVSAPISTATEATGERRYLTVMFCDLVASNSAIAASIFRRCPSKTRCP